MGKSCDADRIMNATILWGVGTQPTLPARYARVWSNFIKIMVNVALVKDEAPSPHPFSPTTDSVAIRHSPKRLQIMSNAYQRVTLSLCCAVHSPHRYSTLTRCRSQPIGWMSASKNESKRKNNEDIKNDCQNINTRWLHAVIRMYHRSRHTRPHPPWTFEFLIDIVLFYSQILFSFSPSSTIFVAAKSCRRI